MRDANLAGRRRGGRAFLACLGVELGLGIGLGLGVGLGIGLGLGLGLGVGLGSGWVLGLRSPPLPPFSSFDCLLRASTCLGVGLGLGLRLRPG